MAVGQNQWYHFGVGAPPILVYFSGDWDVHWGYGIWTHGHMHYHVESTFLYIMYIPWGSCDSGIRRRRVRHCIR